MYRLLVGDIDMVISKIDVVNCVVTSPPYYHFRDYGHERQIGQERTVNEYVDRLVGSFSKIRERMSGVGTLFLNMGDKHVGGRLLGIPWRVVFGLLDDGWVLKNDVIWHRNRIMPESVKNRFTKCHEYIFFLTLKRSGYTFNADAVRETAKWAHDRRAGKGRHTYRESRGEHSHTAAVSIASDGKRNRRSVWTIETSQTDGTHSATFPERLPEICVLAGSNEGDVVLDPFVGTGSTGVAAVRNNRSFIGVDIRRDFIGESRRRIRNARNGNA